ncbi:MAG TPA: GNAT family N-acetyltransferase [Nitrososphaerales archaeon]|nr:GNAT family N-acetyltransferase [Nitrososphaerales archaeon]
MTFELVSLRDLELNEVNWWGLWADVSWLSNYSYVMISRDYDEYFFNRAGFLECGDARDAISAAEQAFKAAARSPCFMVPEECRGITQILETKGYGEFDKMSVMRLDELGFRLATGLNVTSGQAVDARDWATTFSLSFYGDLRVRNSVAGIATRLKSEPSVTFLAGKKAGRVAGVLAVFRTPGLLGVYCVGTLEDHRRSGIAGSLLHQASQIASSEGRELVLQTIVSDGVGNFYIAGGFKELYSKLIMSKGAPRADKNEGA